MEYKLAMMLLHLSISTYTSLILLSLSIFISLRITPRQNLFNPLCIFLSAWLVNLFLYDLCENLNYFQFSLSTKADLWLTIALFCFFLGGVSLMWKPSNPLNKVNYKISGIKIIWLINSIIFLLYSSAVLIKYFILYKIFGNFSCSTIAIKQSFFVGVLSFPNYLYFLTLPGYLLISNLGIITVVYKSKMAFMLGLMTLVIALLDSSAVGMRGGFLNFSLLFVTSLISGVILTGEKVTIRHYTYTFLAMLSIAFILALSLYTRSHNNNNCSSQSYLTPELTSLLSVSDRTALSAVMPKLSSTTNAPKYDSLKDAFFFHNLIYVSGTTAAYSYFLENPWSSDRFGIWSFMGVYNANKQVANMIGLRIFQDLNLRTYYAPIFSFGPFNSTNFLTYIYSDFGYTGLIIVPFVFGLFGSYYFNKTRHNKQYIDAQILSILLAGLVCTIRGIITNGVFFWFFIIIAIMQTYIIKAFNK